MRYLSVCSGIESASVAWGPLGWEAAAFAEIAPFPSAVLNHRFPSVPNLGDFTKASDDRLRELGPVQLLIGGTPCQSFSVAGLRAGMRDPRGNLALGFLALADKVRPKWVIWENVPGVLSSNGGRDFGSFVGGLGQLGYGWAYRVLDAQYFGVAQRRRRVFVVGCIGNQSGASEVLFEPHRLPRHFAPRREPGSRPAGTLEARAGSGGFDAGAHGAASGHLVPSWPAETACALQACFGAKQGLEDQHINAGASLFVPVAFDWQSGGDVRLNVSDAHTSALQANQTPAVFQCHGSNVGEMGTLRAGNGSTTSGIPFLACAPLAVSIQEASIGRADTAGPQGVGVAVELAYTLEARRTAQGVSTGTAVRRITPTEAERLQGLPDRWTAIPYRGKPAEHCPDGPRYHAIGNSMAVPVIRWLGERIMDVEGSE